MARQETDRDDLWAEAQALIRRAEWIASDEKTAPLLMGERENGWFSLYDGQDWFWQVDNENRIRRGFESPHLYRTQGTVLACLTRERTADETILHRTDLDAQATEAMLADVHQRLTTLLEQCRTGVYVSERVFPEEPTTATLLLDRLAILVNQPLKLAPRIPGKR